MRHRERGQTLVETALFLPLVLLAMFGTIYVSQLFVVSERTQLAVRYGSPETNPGTLYSVAAIYNASSNLQLATCTPAPTSVLWDGAPLPGPTSAPYWQPAPTPSATCNAAYSNNQGAQFLSLYVASTQQTVSASVSVPVYLQKAAGLTAGVTTTASEAFARPADPASIMCHSKEVNSRVLAALLAASPAPATPVPAGTASPLPQNNAC